MKLITCGHCGRPFYDKEKACPYCGHAFSSLSQTKSNNVEPTNPTPNNKTPKTEIPLSPKTVTPNNETTNNGIPANTTPNNETTNNKIPDNTTPNNAKTIADPSGSQIPDLRSPFTNRADTIAAITANEPVAEIDTDIEDPNQLETILPPRRRRTWLWIILILLLAAAAATAYLYRETLRQIITTLIS